jgi:hypothetical protein
MDSREPIGAVATLPAPEPTIGSAQGVSGTKDEVKTLLQDAKRETTRLADAARLVDGEARGLGSGLRPFSGTLAFSRAG